MFKREFNRSWIFAPILIFEIWVDLRQFLNSEDILIVSHAIPASDPMFRDMRLWNDDRSIFFEFETILFDLESIQIFKPFSLDNEIE